MNKGASMQISTLNNKTTRAQKLGAYFLLINAFFIVLGIILGIEENSQLPKTITASIIDIAIGISIIMNKDKWILYAKIRVIGGLIVYSVIAIASKDYWTLFVQVLLSISMLLVLLGNAGKVRKILSIILFSFIILLYTIGTFSLYSGDSLIDGFRLTKEYTLIDIDDNDMFKLPSLPQKWKMRSKDSYSDENQYVDLWLVDPFKDSHIMIIYESFDYMHGIEHQTLIENILNNAKAVGEIDVLNEDRDIYNLTTKKEEVRNGINC